MKTTFLILICFISKAYAQQGKDYFISIDTIAANERNAYSRTTNIKNATSAKSMDMYNLAEAASRNTRLQHLL